MPPAILRNEKLTGRGRDLGVTLIAVAITLLALSCCCAKQEFVTGTKDVPLYPNAVLDKPPRTVDVVGKFSTTTAVFYTTSDDAEEVKKFYKEALPKYGWEYKPVASTKMTFTFLKDNRLLELFVSEYGKTGTQINITLAE